MSGEKRNLCGANIKAYRKQRKLKQLDVVTALEEDFGIKLDSTSFGRIERFERGVWDYELVAIAHILNVSVQELIKSEEENFRPVG